MIIQLNRFWLAGFTSDKGNTRPAAGYADILKGSAVVQAGIPDEYHVFNGQIRMVNLLCFFQYFCDYCPIGSLGFPWNAAGRQPGHAANLFQPGKTSVL